MHLSAGITGDSDAIISSANQHAVQSAIVKKKKNTSFKIKIRGKDDTPLSMTDLRQGMYEIAKRLERYDKNYRAKWATVFLTMIDEDGEEVILDPKDEWTIRPYRTAADEYEI